MRSLLQLRDTAPQSPEQEYAMDNWIDLMLHMGYSVQVGTVDGYTTARALIADDLKVAA